MKKYIIHSLSLILLFTTTLFASAESGKITGKVTDEDNNPLVGVNVMILNSTKGSATDVDGTFVINEVSTGTKTIVASMVGFTAEKTQLIVQPNQTTEINFKLRATLLEMGTVVVTGTTSPYLYENTPVKTEVVHNKLIRQQKASNLAEALSLQTGVRVENNCQNCNFTQVRILGFDGRYSQILIDGDPVVSTLAGVYGLEHFPDEMISQIEIVKGGGSALYGGGAVAGTINLITKRPQLNQTSISYQAQSLEGVMDQQIGAVAEITNAMGTAGAFVYGSARNRNPYDRNGDGYSELGRLNSETIGFNMFYNPTKDGEISASLHRIHEDRRGGNDFGLKQHEADIAEWVDHLRWGGKVKWEDNINDNFSYNVNYAFSLLNRDSYYGGLAEDTEEAKLEALGFYGNAKEETHLGGVQATYNTDMHTFTGGIEYHQSSLQDNSVKDKRYLIDETETNFGAYIQDQLVLMGDRLILVGGLRVDKNSELEDPVLSPRFNVKYEITHELNMRLAFSTGFKAPGHFDEDLHIESLAGNQRVIRNVDGLEAEHSTSYSGGFEFQGFLGKTPLLIGITGFYTELTDAFSEVEAPTSPDGLVIWNRVNSDGAKAYGIEFDFGIKPINDVEVRSGFTVKKGEYESEQEIFDGVFEQDFLRSPNVDGYVRVSYDPSDELNLFTSAKYTGSMLVPNEATSEIVEVNKSFVEIDLGATYKVPAFQSFGGALTLGIKNLTDTYQEDLQIGADRDPAYLYGPMLPRRIYFAFETSF